MRQESMDLYQRGWRNCRKIVAVWGSRDDDTVDWDCLWVYDSSWGRMRVPRNSANHHFIPGENAV